MVRVGLASWIIQDGNYGDFESGSRHRFALEFYPHESFALNEPTEPAIVRELGGIEYEVRANVILATSSYWVIDFGLPAFRESTPPPWAAAGVSFTGRISLGIDPFFYFERLKDESGMPDLFRNWQIHRVLVETTRSREITYREVPRTDAWNDDGGNAGYILECELVEFPDVLGPELASTPTRK